MADLTDELNEIAQTMEDLLTLAHEKGFCEILERLYQAAMKIMASASRSWFGYHANVYLKDFQPPSRGEHFSRRYGLYERSPSGQASPGSWRAYEPEVVMRTIKQGAGNPDLDALTSYNQQAGDELPEATEDNAVHHRHRAERFTIGVPLTDEARRQKRLLS